MTDERRHEGFTRESKQHRHMWICNLETHTTRCLICGEERKLSPSQVTKELTRLWKQGNDYWREAM